MKSSGQDPTPEAAGGHPDPDHSVQRIVSAYERRKETVPHDRYSYFQAGALFMAHQREREFFRLFKKVGLREFKTQKILDVGCGYGVGLREFIRWGARPENLFGIDLLGERVEVARHLCPACVSIQQGNATALPWSSGTFDLVSQGTLFTSLLDPQMRRQAAQEMVRVLKPGGMVLWFDFRVNNPRNPDVRGVGRREIQELFPGCAVCLLHTVLLPPLARRLAPYSWLLCEILAKIPFLCTHYAGAIRRPVAQP